MRIIHVAERRSRVAPWVVAYGSGSIENICATLSRYKFLELAVNGAGKNFRKKRYTVTLKALRFSQGVPRFFANTAGTD